MASSAADPTVPSPPSSSTPSSSRGPSRETKALISSNTALSRARTQLTYLFNPSSTHLSTGTLRLRTRALLRTLHYIGLFIYWRLVRWAKYAIIGSAVAALGSFAVAGSMASGVGVLLAPPGILASVGVGTVWGVGRWVWRSSWVRRRTGRGKVSEGAESGDGGRKGMQEVRDPGLMPW